MLWPSNRNKGDDPDGNNSDLKFNSPIRYAGLFDDCTFKNFVEV